jgi:death-on-curing protein
VLAIHDEQIAEHGGASGVRDLAVIDSALARPQNLLAYRKPYAAALAAAYAFGLCGNRGFLDRNKRTAWAVAETFLNLNGHIINASDDAVVSTMQATAAGQMPEDQLAKRIRSLLQSTTPGVHASQLHCDEKSHHPGLCTTNLPEIPIPIGILKVRTYKKAAPPPEPPFSVPAHPNRKIPTGNLLRTLTYLMESTTSPQKHQGVTNQ